MACFTPLSSVARRRSTRLDANDMDPDKKDKEKEKIIVPSRVKRVSVATSSFLNAAGAGPGAASSVSPRSMAAQIPFVQPTGPAEDIKYQVHHCCCRCTCACACDCGLVME